MQTLAPKQLAPFIDGALGLRFGDQWVQPIRLPVEDLDFHHAALKSGFTGEAAAGVRLLLRTTSTRLALIASYDVSPWIQAPPAYDLVTENGSIRRVTAMLNDDTPSRVVFEDLPPGAKALE